MPSGNTPRCARKFRYGRVGWRQVKCRILRRIPVFFVEEPGGLLGLVACWNGPRFGQDLALPLDGPRILLLALGDRVRAGLCLRLIVRLLLSNLFLTHVVAAFPLGPHRLIVVRLIVGNGLLALASRHLVLTLRGFGSDERRIVQLFLLTLRCFNCRLLIRLPLRMRLLRQLVGVDDGLATLGTPEKVRAHGANVFQDTAGPSRDRKLRGEFARTG